MKFKASKCPIERRFFLIRKGKGIKACEPEIEIIEYNDLSFEDYEKYRMDDGFEIKVVKEGEICQILNQLLKEG